LVFFSRCREQKRMGWSLCRASCSARCCRHRRRARSGQPYRSRHFCQNKGRAAPLWRKRPPRLYPRQPETIVAVTGTSGKTSVTDFVRQIWTALGAKAASLGTLGVVAPSGPVAGSLTRRIPGKLGTKTLDGLARRRPFTISPWRRPRTAYYNAGSKAFASLAAAFTNLSREPPPTIQCNA